MSISDEEFEQVLSAIEVSTWSATVDHLRTRDTAQREALARVEAERDCWKEQRDILADYCRRADQRARTAQAQLAETVGLLKYVKDWFGYGDLPESLSKLDDFLARHAKAEQQEAPDAQLDKDARIALLERELDSTRERADMAEVELQNARAALATQAEQQEAPKREEVAHGAQAGEFKREDRYIVIKRKDLERVPLDVRMPFILAWSELGPRLPKRECLVIESDWPEYEPTWAAIRARMTGRAALATQPAVRGAEHGQ